MKTVTYDETRWKLVPIEMDSSMAKAGRDASSEADDRSMREYGRGERGMSYRLNRVKHIYKALLATAPEPPAQPAVSDEQPKGGA